MKAYLSAFKFGIRQISRDYMLLLMMFAPILCGIFFKFLIPIIDESISKGFGVERIILPYYQILDITLVFLAPSIVCTILSFLILEEKDDNINSYIFVTPVGYNGYIFARLILPSIFALLLSVIVLMLFKLTNINMLLGISMAILSILYALASTLIVVSSAKNKVEGLALVKLTGMTFLGVLAPFFIKGNAQYIFSFLPSFWLSKVLLNYGYKVFPISLILGFFCGTIWIIIFYMVFKRKIAK